MDCGSGRNIASFFSVKKNNKNKEKDGKFVQNYKPVFFLIMMQVNTILFLRFCQIYMKAGMLNGDRNKGGAGTP
jgi:hypothetical protein